jgi:hypothetical protein
VLPGLPDRRLNERTDTTLRSALAAGWRELVLYLVAGAVYVAIGVAVPEFLFSWVVAAGYLLICIVLIPFVARWIRG